MQRRCVPEPLHAMPTWFPQILDRARVHASCMSGSEWKIQIHTQVWPWMGLKSSDLMKALHVDKCIHPISHWDKHPKEWEWDCHVFHDIWEHLIASPFLGRSLAIYSKNTACSNPRSSWKDLESDTEDFIQWCHTCLHNHTGCLHKLIDLSFRWLAPLGSGDLVEKWVHCWLSHTPILAAPLIFPLRRASKRDIKWSWGCGKPRSRDFLIRKVAVLQAALGAQVLPLALRMCWNVQHCSGLWMSVGCRGSCLCKLM